MVSALLFHSRKILDPGPAQSAFLHAQITGLLVLLSSSQSCGRGHSHGGMRTGLFHTKKSAIFPLLFLSLWAVSQYALSMTRTLFFAPLYEFSFSDSNHLCWKFAHLFSSLSSTNMYLCWKWSNNNTDKNSFFFFPWSLAFSFWETYKERKVQSKSGGDKCYGEK